MKKISLVVLVLLLCSAQAFAQVDRREVRSGNRAFKKGEWTKAEIDYKKALLKDSTSVAAQYNLANALYREENYTEAEKYSKAALDSLSRSPRGADAYFNNGDIYLQQRRWREAIEAFKESLRRNPDDMDAKSNLAYAQKMLYK
ncbi:MAG: tetratricopeptide repeat protein [Bacteroidales bacterium]|nr:tetratricopeptide repeat protein [Bacteroidales bacterium]